MTAQFAVLTFIKFLTNSCVSLLIHLFPVRHTGYDNYKLYTEFLDKDFTILNTCSQVIVHLVRELADSKLLPFDIQEYENALGQAYDHVQELSRNMDLPPEVLGQ